MSLKTKWTVFTTHLFPSILTPAKISLTKNPNPEKPLSDNTRQNQTKVKETSAAQLKNIPWNILFLATGIGIYFNAPFEGNKLYLIIMLLTGLILWLATQSRQSTNTLITAFLIILFGYSAAYYRTLSSYTPLLSNQLKSYDIQMRVIRAEPQQRSQIRYTGTTIKLSKLSQANTPVKIRIRATDQGPRFQYGDLICARALLSRPKGPLRPNGYDFGQALWYQQIGGTGFAISQINKCPQNASAQHVNNANTSPLTNLIAYLRNSIGLSLDSNLKEPHRALARAIILGDRGRIETLDLEALRNAGLGHLLAISGLHMAIFAGTLFFISRAIMAIFPNFTEQYPIKKYAALIAFIGGTLYFLISGQSIPTQRAYLMIIVIFTAIIIERPALTIRNVILAATIILILRPESLITPGFQMSFAAVTALVVTYQANLKYQPLQSLYHITFLKPVYYVMGIWVTSIVATLATAPFAIYHFNNVSYMGPIGNMLAIPVFSFLVMPFAVLSLLLMPLGLEHIGLKPLTISIEILLKSAHWTSSFKPAIIQIGEISISSVIMFTLSAIILFFAGKKARYLALPLFLLSIITARPNQNPSIYVNERGDLLAIRADDNNLYATSGRKGDFVLQNWLKADGAKNKSSDVRNSPYLICDDSACAGTVSGKKVSLIRTIDTLKEECEQADILIYNQQITRPCKHPILILTKSELTKYGTHAIYINNNQIRVEKAYSFRQNRLWSGIGQR